MKWEDFADYDDAYFTLFTLRGQNLSPTIWRENGRFFPLGHQEFNLMRHFTNSPMGYHALPFIQLIIVAGVLMFLDEELSISIRIALAASLLILPSIVISFTGLVFPDRNVVFWLAWLILFVKLFDKTSSIAWAAASIVSAQMMMYYKETAFLLVVGFAAGRLFFRSRHEIATGWDFSRLRNKESVLDLTFIALALIFLVYYMAAMTPHVNMAYVDQNGEPLGQVLLYYLKLDLLIWIFLAVVARRGYLVIKRRIEPSPLWDGLAIGGVLCFAAYLYLRLCTPYYLAPIDLIAVLYVGRFIALSYSSLPEWEKAAAYAIVLAVIIQGVSLSSYRLFERKNAIHAKAELADAIALQSLNGSGRVRKLFFPFSDIYPITEFASYLTYRGIHIEGESNSPQSFEIVSRAFTSDQPCVSYRNFICHAGNVPEAGDLVIELPDDLESDSDIGPYRQGSRLLSYEPQPKLSHSAGSVLNYLRVVSVRLRFRDVPDRWMHASMTEWKG